MLEKILNLQGVKKLSKKDLHSFTGSGCTCNTKEGHSYTPHRSSVAHRSAAHCWSFCDLWRRNDGHVPDGVQGQPG
ncbi:conserved hypothetical protein [Tenacibaculum sp. 190524A02b]|uniref:Uncharacterized protein n=1 Tax=Tenacibaculum vairaonense TaxID=3137860 RepID=A0ABM9PIA7_9FLAO